MIQSHTHTGKTSPIGISDIGVYLTNRGVPVDALIAGRSGADSDLRARLHKANKIAGQKFVRFPHTWEDSVTLAAESARQVLQRITRPGIMRLLAVGTETPVDHAKPVAAYVQGLLKADGLDLGNSLSTLQLQHACAGSTMGLLHTAGLLNASGRHEERGLVLSTDISRYSTGSSGELTQGAGAVAVLVEHDPSLLAIDLATVGQFSADADDFFRPLGESAARVRGGHSIKCYRKALAAAFKDHCRQRDQAEHDVIKDTDFFVLHTPFRNMPDMAFEWFLHKHGLGCNGDGLYSKPHGACLRDATDQVAFTGNLYNGAIYFVLAHLLQNLYRNLGNDIVGKRIVLGSYGSGSTMVVLNTTVTAGAPEVIQRWNLATRDSAMSLEDYESFERWADLYDTDPYVSNGSPAQPGQFYLKEIRSDGYRVYDIS
ncbi:hydroxymethylglutaryl-CoA synthase family protein [Planctomycetota bacterium]